MTPSIPEVLSHLTLGALVSLVCNLGTVGSHPTRRFQDKAELRTPSVLDFQ